MLISILLIIFFLRLLIILYYYKFSSIIINKNDICIYRIDKSRSSAPFLFLYSYHRGVEDPIFGLIAWE